MLYKKCEKLNLKLHVFGFDHMNSLCVLCISVTCIKSQITFPSWSIIQKYEVIDTTKRNRAINLILPPLANFMYLIFRVAPTKKIFYFLFQANFFTCARFKMKSVQKTIIYKYLIDLMIMLTKYFHKNEKSVYDLGNVIINFISMLLFLVTSKCSNLFDCTYRLL